MHQSTFRKKNKKIYKKTQTNVISTQNAAKISLENGLKMMENCFEKVLVDVGCENEAMQKK